MAEHCMLQLVFILINWFLSPLLDRQRALPFILLHATVRLLCHPLAKMRYSLSFMFQLFKKVFLFPPQEQSNSPRCSPQQIPAGFTETYQRPLPPLETGDESNYEEICTGDGRLSQVPWKFHFN